MQFFEQYVSNTIAGSSNQFFFESDGKAHTGRIFYKVFCGGMYEYAFLFSNVIDSTYADGKISHCNLLCDSWEIVQMRVAVSSKATNDILESSFSNLTFGNQISKKVMPGEFFSTDSVVLNAQKEDYICLEISFRGNRIPYHEENIIPAYVRRKESWILCNHMPFASMVGCKRTVKGKIAYLGDSITQGIGTEFNSYTHWNAVLSEMLGEEYAYWNLGIGFGRASDAASNGAWLYKAKQNDIVVVCFGVNDLLQGRNEEQIESDLKTIVKELKMHDIRIVLQTIPPFDYNEDVTRKWFRVNDYIKSELAKDADCIFDMVPLLCECEGKMQNAKYGGHPNKEGCGIWANALYTQMKKLLEGNVV